MVKILFVCMGNICRSPMAEAVMQDMINKAGLSDQISVDSAGTSSEHAGQTAFPDTLEILSEHNIPYDGRSRPIQRNDLKEFDYVLAMDRSNLSYILRASSGARADIRLFLSFAKRAGLVSIDEVPDPYYDGNFEQTYELVTRGCQALLDHIRQQNRI